MDHYSHDIARDSDSYHSQAPNTLSLHKRVYQACLPCRKRKVRCDLGPVDNPHDPPCVRCRRESKECFFSATRRKRRDESGDDLLVDDTPEGHSSYTIRRKNARIQDPLIAIDHLPQSPVMYGMKQDPEYSNVRDTTGHASLQQQGRSSQTQEQGSRSRNHNQPYATAQSSQYSPDQDQDDDQDEQEVTNEEAAVLFQSPIHTPVDAIHLLLKASDQSEAMQREARPRQPPFQQPVHSVATIAHGAQSNHHIPSSSPYTSQQTTDINRPSHSTPLDPAMLSSVRSPASTAFPTSKALSIWSRLRFVRAGWFTAREAMAYIDYYYDYMAPLTPIILPNLRDLEAYPNLLSEEPLLTVTILTIASRYMQLGGAGSQTRSLMVHERLWQYLQSMTTRMFWAQEQFGGGFCRAGGASSSRRAGVGSGLGTVGAIKAAEKGRLRTLGTVERSVMMLSCLFRSSLRRRRSAYLNYTSTQLVALPTPATFVYTAYHP